VRVSSSDQPWQLPAVDPASAAQAAFERAARAAGLDPADRWVGGYADYEWRHLRRLLEAYRIDISGRDVFELGFNVGGSSVVLAALGARVQGADIDPVMQPVAATNLARHGFDGGGLRHVGDTRALPFAAAAFDVILANSVLEYVDPAQLDGVIAELHRILRPGGQMLICGTASRLSPREGHSRRWLVNYLPRGFDRLTGRAWQRGLSPLALARALRGRFTPVGQRGWGDARCAIHGRLSPAARLVSALARLAGIGPGWIAPYIELLLVRR
jgi:SAM-dependent methyltransferase